jgi:hypothetical protein
MGLVPPTILPLNLEIADAANSRTLWQGVTGTPARGSAAVSRRAAQRRASDAQTMN